MPFIYLLLSEMNIKKQNSSSNDKERLVHLLSLWFPKCIEILQKHYFLTDLITYRYVYFTETDSKYLSINKISTEKIISSKNVYTIDRVWAAMKAEVGNFIHLHLQGVHVNIRKEEEKKKPLFEKPTVIGFLSH